MTLIDSGKETLLELAGKTHEQSISIFIPTHQRGKEVNERQDTIAFKNHLQTIRLALEAKSLRSNDVDDLMQPLEALLADADFWHHQQQGLAVFRSPDYFGVFHSPLPLPDESRLDTRFQVRPLLPFAQPFPYYYLLQLSKNGIKLHRANAFSMAEVDTTGVVTSGLDEVTMFYDFEEELQGRSTGQGGASTMYTSDDSNREQKEKDHLLADYFRKINEGVAEQIGTQHVPLMLASVAYYQPIYRQVNTYPHLLEEGITGNFDHIQPSEMHRMANELLGDTLDQVRQQRITQYQNSSGGDLISHDVRHLLESGVTGRIEVLFMRADAELWGHFDQETLTATIHDEYQEGDESLLEKIALLTLKYGGEVYVLDDVDFLGQEAPVNVAALYRF
ncbi:baeRF7 domain-containing protein [Fibrella aquatica]|uniref:baeRF7 domain-containing protein n=1 Tax=Fibrella aquatica TaxID=3242487 RepID=UPI00351FA803